MTKKRLEIKVRLQNFRNNLWSYYLSIPKELGDTFIEGDNRRVLCFINDQPPIHSALMPKGDEYTIYIKKDFKQKLKIEEGDEVSLAIEKDSSDFGIPLPESFELLLAQDDVGRDYFLALTKGKQTSLVYLVNKVKNIDSQLAKGLAIMHHLKEAKGMLDFKRLNVLIKEYNNRNKS